MAKQPHTRVTYGTRRLRRDAISNIIAELSAIRDAEQTCLDNTPDNFRDTDTFEVGECAVDVMDEAISLLYDAY